MLGRLMDWLDELTGYDRTSVRAVLFCLAIVPTILFAEWAITSSYDWLFVPDCDAACEERADQFLRDTLPELFNEEEGVPFDPDQYIEDILEDN